MSDAPSPQATVTRRGRLQRRLRRERAEAVRHAVIGVMTSAAIVVVLGGGLLPSGSPATADDVEAADVTDADEDARFTATMVGDVMLGRHVERIVERRGHDALFEHARPWLEGDYVSANLEQVISDVDQDELPEADKLIHLASDSPTADALARAGFTTVSLANNHAMDHGIPGLRDTIEALDGAGLRHAGGGVDLESATDIDYQEHGDLTVATLSFTDVFVEGFIARAFQGGVLQAEPDTFVPLLEAASREADLVIAHVHWGEEYDLRVRADQREMAEMMAASGADIIVGAHPHVLLPVEMIDDTLVLHSLGNFVFDQGWSRTRETAIARYELLEDGMARVTLVPTYIREATPRPVTGPLGIYRRERIFHRLRAGEGIDLQRDGEHLVAEIDHRHIGRDDAEAGDATPTDVADAERLDR